MLVLTVMPSPYQRELLDALAQRPGLDVHVRYCTATAPDRQWEPAPLPPHSRVLRGVPLHWISRCCWFNPSIVSHIRAIRPDVAIVGDYFTITAQIAMRYLSWAGVPWVLWSEPPGMTQRGAVGRWLRRVAQRAVRRGAAGIAAIGTRSVRAYRDLVASDMPVCNIPYHCDLSAYLRIERSPVQAYAMPRECAASPPRGVRFLYSGQLIARKGVDVLIGAFRVACERSAARATQSGSAASADGGDAPTLTLLGDGEMRAQLTAALGPRWRSRVRFEGFVQPAALPRSFADADVFVLPSRYDGWGVVVNEAMAAGLPVVATNSVGAAADLVRPGENGFIVAPGDVAALAEAMMRFVDCPALAASMGQAARATARDYSIERGAERWSEFLNDVLRRAGGRPARSPEMQPA